MSNWKLIAAPSEDSEIVLTCHVDGRVPTFLCQFTGADAAARYQQFYGSLGLDTDPDDLFDWPHKIHCAGRVPRTIVDVMHMMGHWDADDAAIALNVGGDALPDPIQVCDAEAVDGPPTVTEWMEAATDVPFPPAVPPPSEWIGRNPFTGTDEAVCNECGGRYPPGKPDHYKGCSRFAPVA